jgi:membrane-bound acyltransferase YfiQ involved in biofilm formation
MNDHQQECVGVILKFSYNGAVSLLAVVACPIRVSVTLRKNVRMWIPAVGNVPRQSKIYMSKRLRITF